jgi:hypothetical protein
MNKHLENLDFDASKVLYIFGAFLGICSIAYFGFELILNLSPTLKSFIILIGSVMFLVSTDLVENSILKFCLFVLSAFSYLSFLAYTFARFSMGSRQVFLILAASSAAFTGLGYVKSEKNFELELGQAKQILGLLTVTIFVLVAFDGVGAQPEYELNLKDTVEVSEGEELSLGVLEVHNDFLFSRNMDLPRHTGCLVFSENESPERIYSSPDGKGIIMGQKKEKFNITETIGERHERRLNQEDEDLNLSGSYKVYNKECPESPNKKGAFVHSSGGQVSYTFD